MTATTVPVGAPAAVPGGATARSVTDLLVRARQDARAAAGHERRPVATGFDLLDRVLDGGLRAHDLLVLAGAPGVGKTVAAVQLARAAARRGHRVVYVGYEHDEATVLGRLLAVELGELDGDASAPEVDRLRGVVTAATAGFADLDAAIAREPLLARACAALDAYGDRLAYVRASGATTDLAALDRLVADEEGDVDLLVVDYLQKVPVRPEPADEAEKVTRTAEGLKDLALRHRTAVVAVVAADQEGLRAPRLRLHHLRGSSALAYECDVAVILNDKHRAVSRVHLSYDPVRAATFHHQVVFSVEKNRGGPAMVDLEFRKDFLHYRFEPAGSYLAERLVDDRLDGD